MFLQAAYENLAASEPVITFRLGRRADMDAEGFLHKLNASTGQIQPIPHFDVFPAEPGRGRRRSQTADRTKVR